MHNLAPDEVDTRADCPPVGAFMPRLARGSDEKERDKI